MFQTTQLLHEATNWRLVGFVFSATLCSYNFHYILAGAVKRKKLSFDLLKTRPTATVILLAGMTGIAILYANAGIPVAHFAIAMLLTFVYSIPLLPFRQLNFARKAGFLKTLLLSFTWTFVTAYIPLVEHHVEFTMLGILIMTKRFLFMLMLCILFDNRDVNVDRVYGLHSLATDLSAKTMQWLIFVVFTLLFTLNFFFGRHGVSNGQVMALQLSSLATLIVYFYSRKKQGYFFYYFIVDGMMVLMTILTTIASI